MEEKLANINNTTTTTTTRQQPISTGKNRICSLQEWTCQYEQFKDECQIIYVFFIGGNPDGPPILLNESMSDFRSMLFEGRQVPFVSAGENDTKKTTISTTLSTKSIIVNKREPGVIYLNIRENQFDGKMTTWFQFAALVGREYPEIDFAAKVDSDLLLLTPNFLQYMEDIYRKQQTKDQSPKTVRTYGGVEFPSTNCVINQTFDHPCPLPLVGPSYMSGELNFMTMDLARYIVSDDCPRDELTIPHEDVSLSNYVYSFVNNTRYHEKNPDLVGQEEGSNADIEIVSVNTSQILITTALTAGWNKVSLGKNPELFSFFLWGHSIKRGKHKQFLVWKQESSFRMFWEKFMKVHVKLLLGETVPKEEERKIGRQEMLNRIKMNRMTKKGNDVVTAG